MSRPVKAQRTKLTVTTTGMRGEGSEHAAAPLATSRVLRIHRLIAAEEWYYPNSWKHRQILRWVESGELNAGIAKSLERLAQVIADAEARGAARTPLAELTAEVELPNTEPNNYWGT